MVEAHRISPRTNGFRGLSSFVVQSGTRWRISVRFVQPLGMYGCVVQEDLSVLVLKQELQLLSSVERFTHIDPAVRIVVNIALADWRQTDTDALATRALSHLVYQLLREAMEEKGARARSVAHGRVQRLAPSQPVLLLTLRPDACEEDDRTHLLLGDFLVLVVRGLSLASGLEFLFTKLLVRVLAHRVVLGLRLLQGSFQLLFPFDHLADTGPVDCVDKTALVEHLAGYRFAPAQSPEVRDRQAGGHQFVDLLSNVVVEVPDAVAGEHLQVQRHVRDLALLFETKPGCQGYLVPDFGDHIAIRLGVVFHGFQLDL